MNALENKRRDDDLIAGLASSTRDVCERGLVLARWFKYARRIKSPKRVTSMCLLASHSDPSRGLINALRRRSRNTVWSVDDLAKFGKTSLTLAPSLLRIFLIKSRVLGKRWITIRSISSNRTCSVSSASGTVTLISVLSTFSSKLFPRLSSAEGCARKIFTMHKVQSAKQQFQ